MEHNLNPPLQGGGFMSKKLIPSISVFISLTSLTPNLTLAHQLPATPKTTSNIHGLNRVHLDQWTHSLQTERNFGTSVTRFRNSMSEAFKLAQDERDVFKITQALLDKALMQNSQDYENLAVMLLELRQELRQNPQMQQSTLRDSLFLLQMMAEESLYVGSKKFPDFAPEILYTDDQIKVIPSSANTATLRGFKVQKGDVVLSKATGSGSSSFIALSMDHPHVYSHSTPIYVDNEGQVLSPEAEIEDGVKLRSMTKEYINGSKTRMHIYRYLGANQNEQFQLELGMDNFIANMYKKTNGDPFNKASYIYDFSMTPGEAESRGLFCSSVSYQIYLESGLIDFENPYGKFVWSPVSDVRESLLTALNMNTDKVPAPGDLELNKNFRLVGARIDITKLHQDRIEMAIIDSFMTSLTQNKNSIQKLSAAIQDLGNNPINKQALLDFANSGLLPKPLAEKLASAEKIPDSINIKQLLFFGFINNVMTPKLRTVLLEQVSELEKKGVIVGPQELRKMVLNQKTMLENEINSFKQKIENKAKNALCAKPLI